MATMRRLGEWLARPFLANEAPHTHAVLRIGLGLLVIANVWTLWPHVDYLYGDLGVSPADTACGEGLARLSLLCHLPGWGPQVVIVLFTVVALALTAGLWTRISCILTTALYATIWWRSRVSWAGDHVFADFLFLLCFARSGEVWSLDRLLRRRRGDESLRFVPSWPRYLIVLQLALCLGLNGWMKYGSTWSSGDALFLVLAHDRYHRFPPWALLDALGPAVTQAMTLFGRFAERGFPLVILGLAARPWLRALGAPRRLLHAADWTLGRRVWASLGACTLLSIAVLLNVGWFPLATAVAVVSLFRGDELARLADRSALRTLAPARPRARVAVVLAAVFAGWHGLVITTRALVPLTGETVAAPLARLMDRYQQMINNSQYWELFAPNVPSRGHYLRVLAITADGERHDGPSDLDLLDRGQSIKLGYDRRYRIYGFLLDKRGAPLRSPHARWVCRTWRSPSGAPPVEVSLVMISGPLPSWTDVLGSADPRETVADREHEAELLRVRCDGR